MIVLEAQLEHLDLGLQKLKLGIMSWQKEVGSKEQDDKNAWKSRFYSFMG
jgi:hypothetical protein